MAIATAPEHSKQRLSFAEYIEQERISHVKHHYYYGRLIEVAGASLEHNTICGNLIVTLGTALAGTDCRVMPSDMKIFISQNVGYYPDVVVACGLPLIAFGEALQNPILIVEVLSPSTVAFDRGKKLREYLTIPSLRHILFVEQDSPVIDHYFKGEDGVWIIGGAFNTLEQGLSLTIHGKRVILPLSNIYNFVTFDELLSDAIM